MASLNYSDYNTSKKELVWPALSIFNTIRLNYLPRLACNFSQTTKTGLAMKIEL